MKVKCPHCANIIVYSTQNPYRPFCSERCQLIDLGEWASNKYAIPVIDVEKAERELANKISEKEDRESGEGRGPQNDEVQ